MPKINYHRGETRTLVVRKNNWSTKKTYQWHRGKRRTKGLCRAKEWSKRNGIDEDFCPCCIPYHEGSREWKQVTSRYHRRVIDKKTIQEELKLMGIGYEAFECEV